MVTAAGSPETFAGWGTGSGSADAPAGQAWESWGEIEVYRRRGRRPGMGLERAGGADAAPISGGSGSRERAGAGPLTEYLRSSVGLIRNWRGAGDEMESAVHGDDLRQSWDTL